MWEILAKIFMFGQCGYFCPQLSICATDVLLYCALPEEPWRCFFSLVDKTSHLGRSCVSYAFLRLKLLNSHSIPLGFFCVFSKEYTQKKSIIYWPRLSMTGAAKLSDFSIKHARSVLYTVTLLRCTWPTKVRIALLAGLFVWWHLPIIILLSIFTMWQLWVNTLCARF